MLRRAATVRGASGMAVATAVSRATGFLRTLAIAWALGATALGDAYNVANTAPNMIFQLAAGGVLSSSIVPVLARSRDDERRSSASALYGLVLLVAAIAAILVALAAPWVIRPLTAGATGRTEYDELAATATAWLRFFAPQVVAYALGVYAVAVMTYHRRLVLGAAASIATNVVTIVGAIAFVAAAGSRRPSLESTPDDAILLLGLATTAGVVTMTAIQLWGAHRVEPGLRPRIDLRHRAVRQLLTLAPWVTLYVVLNQIGLAVVTAMASSVRGGVSAYQWAFTVMQLPHAIVAVSITSAAFPRIAALAAEGRDPTQAAVNALASITRLLVPAAAILAVAAPTIGLAVVGRANDQLVAAAVVGFAASLVPFSLFQLATRTSYAFQDTKGPALVNIVVNVVNVAVNAAVLLVADSATTRLTGLALGHAASYVAGVPVLVVMLRRKRDVRLRLPGASARIALLTAAAAAVIATAVLRLFDPDSQAEAVAALAVAALFASLPLGAIWLTSKRSRRPA